MTTETMQDPELLPLKRKRIKKCIPSTTECSLVSSEKNDRDRDSV
jgi:hypothetical protein